MPGKNGQDEFALNPNSKLKIKVINDLCIGASNCSIIAPKTFELDDDGIAFLKADDWDDIKAVIDAAKSCPTTAIIVEDIEGNQIYPEISPT